MSEKWIVVTGASRGIGFELTKILVQNNYNIIHLGRTKSGFEHEFLELDLSQAFPVSCMQNLHNILSHKNIHGFVYAAGVMPMLEDKNLDPVQRSLFWNSQQVAMQVNYLSCVQLTSEIIPYLLNSCCNENNNQIPYVAHFTSLAAVDPFVGLELYGTTKAAALSYYARLSTCFDSNKLQCLSIHPGTVHTDMVENIIQQGSPHAVIVKLFKQLLSEKSLLNAAESAEKISEFLLHREDLKINSHGKMFLADSFKIL